MPNTSFAALVAVARRHVGMTAAEFDFSLSSGNGRALGAFSEAAYRLATEGLPVVDMTTPKSELVRRVQLRDELIVAHRDNIVAMVAEAKGKSYTGWSDASRGPIRYS